MAGTVERGDGSVVPALMPRAVRRLVLVIVGVLVAFAAYLMALNGPALIYDLAHAAVMFCL
jgi:hypothetical protein